MPRLGILGAVPTQRSRLASWPSPASLWSQSLSLWPLTPTFCVNRFEPWHMSVTVQFSSSPSFCHLLVPVGLILLSCIYGEAVLLYFTLYRHAVMRDTELLLLLIRWMGACIHIHTGTSIWWHLCCRNLVCMEMESISENRDRFRRHRQDGTNLVLSDMMEMTTSKPTDSSSNNPQIALISNGYAALTKQTNGALFPRTE